MPETIVNEQHLDDPIWGTRSIASAIGRTEDETYYLLSKTDFPAVKVGNRWMTTRRRYRNYFAKKIDDAATPGVMPCAA